MPRKLPRKRAFARPISNASCRPTQRFTPRSSARTGPDGTCWQGSSAAAAQCATACENALAEERAANPLACAAPDLAAPAAPTIVITKSGAAYTGPTLDPGLDAASDCTDAPLEPNNTLATATDTTTDKNAAIVLDAVSPKLLQLAICPQGSQDQDWYKVSLPAGTVAMSAEIFYSIEYGDLDVAVQDANGGLVAADGTATNNGCVSAPAQPGTYYVFVAGAQNLAVNNYELRIRAYSSLKSCATITVAP